MKRRDFIHSSAIMGVGVSLLKANQSSSTLSYLPQKKSLKILENANLCYEIFNDASTIITDKKNNYTWQQGPVAIQDSSEIEENNCWFRGDRKYMEQYPGRFLVKKQGEMLHYTLLGRQNRIIGSFFCQYTLEDDWLTIQLLNIDESIPSLIFPTPIFSDAVVLPHHAGRLVKTDEPDIWTREFLPFYTHMNMKMFGGIHDRRAWIGIYGENSVDAGAFLYNGHVTPVWLKSLGSWQGDYSISFRFFRGDYVEIAKTYRRYLMDTGQFISLTEKVERNPLVNGMVGGRILSYNLAFPALNKSAAEDFIFKEKQIKNRRTQKEIRFTYQDLRKSIEYAQTKGFKKGLINVRGWINGGYDYSHPDVWPPDLDLGDYHELATLMGSSKNIPFCLHDNYQDIYDHVKSFPKGVLRRPDGSMMPGGLWAGGQAYMLNSRDSLAYVERNWEKIRVLNPGAIFPDTVTAAKLLQSFERGNTLTRLQDLRLKTDILEYFHDQGILVGSEEGADFGTPICTWFENRHERKEGETIPLWSLVFHDSVFNARYVSFSNNRSYAKWLEDMLWGYQLLFHMKTAFGNITKKYPSKTKEPTPTIEDEEIFTSTFHVDSWHEEIAMSEMISHRFVTDDMKVEETVFANGKRIVVNFGSQDIQVDGKIVKGRGYLIS